jgi:N-acetylmuramoyl-L-alanine amidase
VGRSARTTPCIVLAAIALATPASGAQAAGAGSSAPVVVVDPGHDALPNPATEPIGPGSPVRKIKDGGGTRGVVTGTPEAVVALQVSSELRSLLRRAGLRVVLTRNETAGVSMGNVARARIANRARGALFLRVHADGSADSSVRGTHTLYPAFRRGWTDDIHGASLRAARLVQTELVRALRSQDRGLAPRRDLTGFNWADLPSVLVELGYMTNPDEDRLLARMSYRRRAALGLCRGVLRFVGLPPARCR